MSLDYTPIMKQREYIEGPEALENFERFATATLQTPATKKKQAKQLAYCQKRMLTPYLSIFCL